MAGLYIHIPYCIKKCAYCDFVSVPTDNGVPEAYFRALLKEADLYNESIAQTKIDTVFIGGGTPSLLSSKQMEVLIKTLQKRFCFASDLEFTVECNPGTIDFEKLSVYYALGVNRLSIGLQSSSDRLLKMLGRIYAFSDFLTAVDCVHRAGFNNFNVDIMYGLPGQSADDLLESAEAVSDTGATHISAYSLILEENTPLYDDVKNGKVTLPDEDSVADMEEILRKYLHAIGYERYEISNYAKKGFRCLHNINYWKNGEYIGLGPAAHSAFRENGSWMRWNNTNDIRKYIHDLTNGTPSIIDKESIELKEEMFETVMLGLRMTEGFELRSFSDRFGVSALSFYKDAIARLRANGWLNEGLLAQGRLALSERGLDVQNSALMLFME